jgi:MFS transporter, DHA1 family, inner membrane transport protein
MPVLRLTVLAAALFAAVLTEVMPVGLLPLLAEAFAVDEQRVGLWVSAYAGVVAASAIPLTAALARWPKRRALLLLLLVYAASNALVLFAPTFEVGLVGRVVGGIAHAGIFSVVVAAAVSLVPPKKTARAVALVNAGVAPALALGLPAATAAGTAWGWRWPFAVMTVVLVALAIVTARLLPRGPTPDRSPASGPGSSRAVLSSLKGRGLQLVGVMTVVLTVGHYSVYTYITPLLVRSGVGETSVSPVLLGYGVAGALGLALAGAFADRHPSRSLRLSVTITALALLALGAVSDQPVGAVLAVLIWGAAFSAAPTLLNTAALRVSAVPDAAPAVVNAMFNVGIATGAWIGGQALQRGGTPWVALLGAALVALALPLTAVTASGRRDLRPSPGRPASEAPGVAVRR